MEIFFFCSFRMADAFTDYNEFIIVAFFLWTVRTFYVLVIYLILKIDFLRFYSQVLTISGSILAIEVELVKYCAFRIIFDFYTKLFTLSVRACV